MNGYSVLQLFLLILAMMPFPCLPIYAEGSGQAARAQMLSTQRVPQTPVTQQGMMYGWQAIEEREPYCSRLWIQPAKGSGLQCVDSCRHVGGANRSYDAIKFSELFKMGEEIGLVNMKPGYEQKFIRDGREISSWSPQANGEIKISSNYVGQEAPGCQLDIGELTFMPATELYAPKDLVREWQKLGADLPSYLYSPAANHQPQVVEGKLIRVEQQPTDIFSDFQATPGSCQRLWMKQSDDREVCFDGCVASSTHKNLYTRTRLDLEALMQAVDGSTVLSEASEPMKIRIRAYRQQADVPQTCLHFIDRVTIIPGEFENEA